MMYSQRYSFDESPFWPDDESHSDGVNYSPEISPVHDLSSAQGLQSVHDLLLDLVQRLSWWEQVGYYSHPTYLGDGEFAEDDEGYSAVQALETVKRIEFVTTWLRDKLLSVPPDELMREVCERLQSVISTLGWELRDLRMRALPPAVGNLVADEETVLREVKRAMGIAYEECKQGLREVAFKVEVRAAGVGLEQIIPHKPANPTSSSRPEGVVPPTQDLISDRTAKQPLKEPSQVALAAYRIWISVGWKQEKIAARLRQEFKRSIHQGNVSKFLKEVREFVEAGGVCLPPLEVKRAVSVDPAEIDKGARQDHQTLRQRSRQTSDE